MYRLLLLTLTFSIAVGSVAAVLGVPTQSPTLQSDFRQDYAYHAAVDGWMKLHRSPATWVQARMQCQAEGSVLASPLDKDLQDTMSIVMANKAHSIFTGISSTISGNEFFSVEGVSLDDIQTEWAYEKLTQQQCIVMKRQNLKSVLADVSCDEPHPYICYKQNSQDVSEVNRCGTPDTEYIFKEDTGHCYKFHDTAPTWIDAYKKCSSEGGYLAIINSEEEAQLLQSIIFKHRPDTHWLDHWTINVGFHDWSDHKILKDRYGSRDDFPYWSNHKLWMTIHGETLNDAGYTRINSGKVGEDDNCVGFAPATKLLHYIECLHTDSFVCEMDPVSELDMRVATTN